MAAAKLSGPKKVVAVDDAAGAAVKTAKGRWALAAQSFLALSVVVALCALLYAPRFFSTPAPHGAIAGFFAPRSTSGAASEAEHLGVRGDADRDGGGGAPRQVLDN